MCCSSIAHSEEVPTYTLALPELLAHRREGVSVRVLILSQSHSFSLSSWPEHTHTYTRTRRHAGAYAHTRARTHAPEHTRTHGHTDTHEPTPTHTYTSPPIRCCSGGSTTMWSRRGCRSATSRRTSPAVCPTVRSAPSSATTRYDSVWCGARKQPSLPGCVRRIFACARARVLGAVPLTLAHRSDLS